MYGDEVVELLDAVELDRAGGRSHEGAGVAEAVAPYRDNGQLRWFRPPRLLPRRVAEPHSSGAPAR